MDWWPRPAVRRRLVDGVVGVMLSEAFHSSVDTGNQLLLLYGLLQARRSLSGEEPVQQLLEGILPCALGRRRSLEVDR